MPFVAGLTGGLYLAKQWVPTHLIVREEVCKRLPRAAGKRLLLASSRGHIPDAERAQSTVWRRSLER